LGKVLNFTLAFLAVAEVFAFFRITVALRLLLIQDHFAVRVDPMGRRARILFERALDLFERGHLLFLVTCAARGD
jgi:hypothetical protein